MSARRWLAAGAVLLAVSAFVPPQEAAAQTVSRGPYLQMGAPTGMTVRWRTNSATDSVVRYGLSANNLPFTAQNSGNRTEHEVDLTGLDPATTYFYSVGNTSGPLAGGNADHKFITSPEPGTEQPTRIWVVGDSGEANASARAVRDAYLNLTGNRYTNLFLMLGDNAYDSGTDNEYQAAVFNTYPSILRQTPVWPTLGNHDGRNANVYFNIFTLPREGEIGGLRSGTESYYSFDYANIHFIVLDSFATNRSTNGAMMSWLRDDVLSHEQPWVIAFWHHPPYSKGSHDSDSESGMIDMRRNALPILEGAGVDLMLSGHSHSYERSFLIDGHYGNSSSFNASNQIDGGDGRVGGDGAYEKPGDFIADPNQGAVYVVAGSSSKISGGSLNHRAMRVSLNRLGSMVLEIEGDTLDATFLDNNGTTRDSFQIVKTLSAPLLTVAASDPTASEAGLETGTFTLTRSGDTAAAVTARYTVSGSATSGVDFQPLSGQVALASGQTTATVRVTPIDDTTVERDETVSLTLSSDPSYEVGQPSAATITIVSDEVPPTLTIAATTPTASEAGTVNGVFTITRAGDSSAALSVNYTVDGTATAGSDYQTLSGSLNLPAGAASAELQVVPIDDNQIEADETVVVTLSANAAYDLGDPDSATVAIESDEALPTVSIAATDDTATEAGTTSGSFTVTRSENTTVALTVRYAVSGTAAPGSDYAALSGSIDLAAGQNSADISVDPVDDTTFEPDETVVVTLSADPAYGIAAPSSGTVTIVSDDLQPPEPVTLQVSRVFDNKNNKSYFPGSSEGTGPYNELRSRTESQNLEVEHGASFWWQIQFQDQASELGDPSEVVVDLSYRAESGHSGNFRAQYRVGSQVLASTDLPVSGSSLNDFTWDLSSVVTTAANLAGGEVRLINSGGNGKKIFANFAAIRATLGGEQPQLPIVTIVASDGTATEAGPTSGAFTVSRAGDSSAALTVAYGVGGTATAVSDYAALGGSVTIAAGATSAAISVDPVDDADVEADETVVATLAAAAAYELGTPASATVTIASDDVAGNLPVVSLTVMRDAASEAGLSRGRYRIDRTGDLSAAMTVRYSVGGTATGGSDYQALSGSKTIKAGRSRTWFDIVPIDDTEVEADETVVATLSADAAYEVGAPSGGTVTIASDDIGGSLPVVSIVASDATATEAGPTSGAFTVSRTGDNSAALTVTYGTAGTATSGGDYAALSGSVTIAAGQTSAAISVDPVDDNDIEADETVVVSLSAGAAYQVGAPASATVAIVSDDVGGGGSVVTITLLRDASETGAVRGRVRIDRTGNLSQALTARYGVSGTATSGSDYVPLSGTKTIKAGRNRAWFDVTPIDDGAAEGNESVVLTIADDPAYQVGAADSVSMTIVDNDQQAAAR